MRLEITRKADLAATALVVLARSGRKMKAAELAEVIGATPGFVPQVIAPLVEHGWVRSEPGPTGGYSAVVDLGSVSLRAVIEAADGPTDTGRCVLEERPCNDSGPCALHTPWTRARKQLLDELERTPMSEIPTPSLGS